METRTRKFSLIFSVKIVHGWFGTTPCPYISLEPDPDCQRFFERNSLIWKRTENGGLVIGEGKAPERAAHYRFLIHLDDTAFFTVTKLDYTGFPQQLLCYSNTSKTNKLAAKKYKNPNRKPGAILGMIDIAFSGAPPATAAREPFLLSFDAISPPKN